MPLIEVRCPTCQAQFTAKRCDALYCSDRCRKRAQRSKTNKAKDDKQAFYRQALKSAFSLMGLGAYVQLRSLAMQVIDSLPDEHRHKLYEALKDDMMRFNRDTYRHSFSQGEDFE